MKLNKLYKVFLQYINIRQCERNNEQAGGGLTWSWGRGKNATPPSRLKGGTGVNLKLDGKLEKNFFLYFSVFKMVTLISLGYPLPYDSQ